MGKTKKIKVLLVDNEEEFAETLVNRLRFRKIDAQWVNSGEDAFDATIEFSPDVVILDLKMPGISGLDVLSKVKTLAPATEVIILTGHGTFDAGITGMERGAFDYMIKPIDLEILVERITEASKKKRGMFSGKILRKTSPRQM
jgi:DNA-binding response OmpR family regulator